MDTVDTPPQPQTAKVERHPKPEVFATPPVNILDSDAKQHKVNELDKRN